MPLDFKNLQTSPGTPTKGGSSGSGATTPTAPAAAPPAAALQQPQTSSSRAQSVLMRGYLRRRSAHLGAWRRRYVLLTPAGLAIYGKETDEVASKHMPLDKTGGGRILAHAASRRRPD